MVLFGKNLVSNVSSKSSKKNTSFRSRLALFFNANKVQFNSPFGWACTFDKVKLVRALSLSSSLYLYFKLSKVNKCPSNLPFLLQKGLVFNLENMNIINIFDKCFKDVKLTVIASSIKSFCIQHTDCKEILLVHSKGAIILSYIFFLFWYYFRNAPLLIKTDKKEAKRLRAITIAIAKLENL